MLDGHIEAEPLSLFTLKTCTKCTRSLPLSDFYLNSGKRSSRCKQCIRDISRQLARDNPQYRERFRKENPFYFKDWAAANPGRLKAYAEKAKEKGRIFSDQQKQNKRNSTVRRHARRRAVRYAVVYGEAFAEKYLELFFSKPKSSADGQTILKATKLAMTPDHIKDLPPSVQERIERLNFLSNKPFGSIGWECSICLLPSDHPSFFDIDHVVAKGSGGADGLHNNQVLCPNCHRLKTLDDFKS